MIVGCTAKVPVALDGRIASHVQGRYASSTEILVGGADTRVKHEDRDAAALIAAQLHANALQSPHIVLRIIFPDIRDDMHHFVNLDILDLTVRLLDDGFEIALCPTHFKKWHSSPTGISRHCASA